MRKKFVTADLHFGHTNIIRSNNRPFKTVDQMDAALISKWNNMIDDDDIVYVLGDFTLGNLARAIHYFGKLNGQIYASSNPWHHDSRWIIPAMKGAVTQQVCQTHRGGALTETFIKTKSQLNVILIPPIYVTTFGDRVIVMSHYPLAVWDRKHHGSFHLHGHCHGSHKPVGRIMDVGVDQHNYMPVSAERILTSLETLPMSVNGERNVDI